MATMIWFFTFLILAFIIIPMVLGVVLVIAALIDIFLEGFHHRYIEGIVEKKLSNLDMKSVEISEASRQALLFGDFKYSRGINSELKYFYHRTPNNSWGTIWIDGERYFFKENKMRFFRQIEIGQKIKIGVSKSNRVLNIYNK